MSPTRGQSDRADIQSTYDRLPPEGRLRIAIRGANHFLFSDDGALLKSHIVLRTLRILGILGIDGRRPACRGDVLPAELFRRVPQGSRCFAAQDFISALSRDRSSRVKHL